MEKFIGTKQVQAKPMNRLEYNEYRGWELPSDENGEDEGYLVEYLDGGKPNHPDHEGYISWSPAEQFENAYQNSQIGMTFGHAIVMAQEGKKIARHGWNGKSMFVLYVPGRVVENLEPNSFYEKSGFEAPVVINGHFDMKAADGSMVVGWLASQTDMAEDDWIVVD